MADKERIGVETTVEQGEFNKGMAAYIAGIAKMNKATDSFVSNSGKTSAADQHFAKVGKSAGVAGVGIGGLVSKMAAFPTSIPGVSSIMGALSSLGGHFVDIGQGVLRFGAVAGGAALVGVTALAAGIIALGASAMGEFANFERLSLSLQSLSAREISQGKEVETARTSRIQLTKEETAEIEGLRAKMHEETLERATQVGAIQEQKQRVWELTQAYGDNGLAVQTAKAKLAEMEYELVKSDAASAKMAGSIAELESKSGSLVTTMEKVTTGQMSYSDALAIAGPRAQDLVDWIQRLAVLSPFDMNGVAMAFRTAMAYGFTSEEAQALTQNMVDFAAATGQTIESANQIALALGQIKAKGKVSGQELIQLTNAGIGTNAILKKMGYTVDDVSNGLVSADEFIKAVTDDMGIFRGEAERQAGTMSGLIASLTDLKSIGLREFFTGTFKAIQPYLADFVDLLSSKEGMATLREWGDILGGTIAGGLKEVGRLIALVKSGGLGLFSGLFGTEGVFLWYELKELVANVAAIFSNDLAPSMDDLSFNILPAIVAALTFVNDHFDEFTAALLGIGLVMAGGVLAAVVAGLFALLTPVNLIIAAGALLAAAWVGNWGGIQEITAATLEGISAAVNTYWPIIQAVFLTGLAVLTGVFNGIIAATLPIQASIAELTAVLAANGISWTDVWNAMMSATGIVASTIGVLLVGMVAATIGMASGIIGAVTAMVTVWSNLTAQIEPALTSLIQYFMFFSDGVVKLFSGDIPGAVLSFQLAFGALVSYVGASANVLYTAITAPLQLVIGFMSGFNASMIGFWQGLFDTLVGNSIVTDMTVGIQSAFDTMVSGVLSSVGTLITGVQSAFSSIFGGGEEATAPTTGFDPATQIAGIVAVQSAMMVLTSIQANYSATAAAGLLAISLLITTISTVDLVTLGTATLTTATLMVAQFLLVWQGVSTLDLLLINMYLLTLPVLLTTTVAVAAAMVTAILLVHGSATALNQMLLTILTNVAAIGPATETSMEQAGAAFDDAADNLNSMIDIVYDAVEAFNKMAEAAAKAAGAADSAGETSGLQTGIGFHRGIGFAKGASGLGWKVPPGYPNDSFGPMFVESGEEMLIAPRGRSIEGILADRFSAFGNRGGDSGGGAITNVVSVTFGDVYLSKDMDVDAVETRIVRTITKSVERR